MSKTQESLKYKIVYSRSRKCHFCGEIIRHRYIYQTGTTQNHSNTCVKCLELIARTIHSHNWEILLTKDIALHKRLGLSLKQWKEKERGNSISK